MSAERLPEGNLVATWEFNDEVSQTPRPVRQWDDDGRAPSGAVIVQPVDLAHGELAGCRFIDGRIGGTNHRDADVVSMQDRQAHLLVFDVQAELQDVVEELKSGSEIANF